MSDFRVTPDPEFAATQPRGEQAAETAQASETAPVSSRVVKTSMTLPQSSIDTIKMLADSSGTTMAEVVRRAIAMEKFLHETTSRGGKILVKDKGRSQVRELLIR